MLCIYIVTIQPLSWVIFKLKCYFINTAQSCKFWKEFNRLYKPPTDTQVEALVKDDGSVITDNTKIEEILFETFFKGKHIVKNQSSFYAKFYEDTNALYKSIIDNEFTNSNDNKDTFQHSSELYNPISEQEVRSTIKDNKSAAGSFDNCKVPLRHTPVSANKLQAW